MNAKAIYRALGNEIFIEDLGKAMQKAKAAEKKSVFFVVEDLICLDLGNLVLQGRQVVR